MAVPSIANQPEAASAPARDGAAPRFQGPGPAARGLKELVGRQTLAVRLRLAFLVLGATLALTMTIAGWAYYDQVQGRDYLVGTVDTAQLHVTSLLADYVDEETGVRGYVLSHREDFLQPWYQGKPMP